MDPDHRVEIVTLSDNGLRRSHNEDSTAADAALGLALLADGMGGYHGGEVASAVAVYAALRFLRTRLAQASPGECDPDSGFALGSLLVREAVHHANLAVLNAAASDERYAGMGTTLVAALLHDDRVSIAHVGDSRAYRYREGHLERLTVDHSVVQELVDQGFYTPEEAAAANGRNVVTRALGVEEKLDVTLHEEPVSPADLILLCSDGLSDMVSDDGIRETLAGNTASLAAAARALVEAANAQGGEDNVSVVLARVGHGAARAPDVTCDVADWFEP